MSHNRAKGPIGIHVQRSLLTKTIKAYEFLLNVFVVA